MGTDGRGAWPGSSENQERRFDGAGGGEIGGGGGEFGGGFEDGEGAADGDQRTPARGEAGGGELQGEARGEGQAQGGAGGGEKGEDVGKEQAASGAYCAREASLHAEEAAGSLTFICCRNDGVDEHMIWLVGLKNIFSRQLPNMPKDYIVRLLLDRTHKSMMLIKASTVVGGITYRPYPSQRFGEIAFCAITATEQVRGYGTRLMNHLKAHARDVDGLQFFLTYADNNAVGYFVKQGFTKEITMPKAQWEGYIKDYDGGTLMECVLEKGLPYTALPGVLLKQRQAITDRIRHLARSHVVHPGMDFPRDSWGVPRRAIRLADIPGLGESGWAAEQSGANKIRLVQVAADGTRDVSREGPPSKAQLHALMKQMHRAVLEHQDSWPFKEPVDGSEVPDYYDIIKDPMDLKTMQRRLEAESFYQTIDMFVADMRRMTSNARTYNAPDTIYFKCANRLENFFLNKLKASVRLHHD
ncbi:hypothetical protein CLOM_g11149 [Closterium sp. NIES-68]|nr:hypothetical protein CLOM_g11149 [Closterium sp. NIES-68]GJP79572.1 hypothetical protein CLOP_g9792 [Closterium sp. NIES-67]